MERGRNNIRNERAFDMAYENSTKKMHRLADFRQNVIRQSWAQKYVDEGRYGYNDPQPYLDGLSLASLDVELADQAADLKRDFGVTDDYLGEVAEGRLMMYSIPECNLDMFKERFAKLARKAEKLGSDPITMKLGEPHDVKRQRVDGGPDYVVRYFMIEVRGTAPKFNGWTLAATLQTMEMEDGSAEGMLRCVPGIEVPRELANRLGDCDHCKAKRQRKDTYVVRHDSGEWKVVGSNCIKDFLGHNSPQALAQIAQYLIEIGQLCGDAEEEGYFGGGMRKPTRFDVSMILCFAAAAIRVSGFCSRKRVRDAGELSGLYATADLVADILFADPKRSEGDRKLLRKYASEEADGELAEAAREWARGHAESTNEYLYNLSLIARAASLEVRNFGLAASMISAYQRELVQRQENKTVAESVHFGEEGKRGRFTLVFLGSTQFESEGRFGGLRTICRFREGNGNMAVWFASGAPGIELTEGESYDVDATVKSHGEYRGKKQTMLTRVALHVEKAPKKSKKAGAEASAA